jgi:hypothetical protein
VIFLAAHFPWPVYRYRIRIIAIPEKNLAESPCIAGYFSECEVLALRNQRTVVEEDFVFGFRIYPACNLAPFNVLAGSTLACKFSLAGSRIGDPYSSHLLLEIGKRCADDSALTMRILALLRKKSPKMESKKNSLDHKEGFTGVLLLGGNRFSSPWGTRVSSFGGLALAWLVADSVLQGNISFSDLHS